MASDRPPSLFVSSTFYDLAQIRRDLREFIESIGLDPILSEFDSFPVNPNQSTVENCLRIVESRADIFILVIGGRYGSLTNDGTSVTNLEFLKAKQKNIPIYVFVLKSTLDMLSVWKDNPGGNFDSVADTPRLFEFVESIRSSGDIWTFPFENAQDIISTLRKQLSFLYMDALEVRSRLNPTDNSVISMQLQGESLRLLLVRPTAWEFRIFAQFVSEKIQFLAPLRRDYKYGFAFGDGGELSDIAKINEFIGRRMGMLAQVPSSLEILFGEVMPESLELATSSGNPEGLIYVSEKIAEAYTNCISWALDFKKLTVPDKYQQLIDMASQFSSNMISEIEEYCSSLMPRILDGVRLYEEEGKDVSLQLTLTLTAPDSDSFFDELQRLVFEEYGEIDISTDI